MAQIECVRIGNCRTYQLSKAGIKNTMPYYLIIYPETKQGNEVPSFLVIQALGYKVNQNILDYLYLSHGNEYSGLH